ncbi:MAG: YeeE/YedE family protein [Deltaproteobacteria bacterium]|jgi:uncharacterized membrane protein YedE/YeeE|nr:YeeE/YedE family protein [Deltaproteobacteria bacterium]MBW2534555.1 YeeE/YedE family protein [Deltaproteobacteria bacterium]
MESKEQKFWNPYLAGVALGLVLLLSFVVMGKGLGASGGVYRIGVSVVEIFAPAHVGASAYMSSATASGSPLDSFYVFMVAGVFLGGLLSAYAAGRFRAGIRRGPRISPRSRLMLAFAGGIIMGFAARLTLGCTSGQALSGGALLSAGSWIFMLSVFGGGYALAYFVRRQWT